MSKHPQRVQEYALEIQAMACLKKVSVATQLMKEKSLSPFVANELFITGAITQKEYDKWMKKAAGSRTSWKG